MSKKTLAFAATLALAGICAQAVSAKPADAPVAQVDGHAVLNSELQAQARDKLDQIQRQYDVQYAQLSLGTARSKAAELESQLEQMLDKRVLGLESAAQKKPESELLAAAKPRPVTDDELHAFYDAQQSQIGQPFEAVNGKIRQFLETQAQEEAQMRYLHELREKYHASISLPPFRETIDPTGPRRGAKNAVVTIVEFSDFQCPFCGRLEPTLQELLKVYPDKVQVIFRNLPLTGVHPNAAKAAEAGVCAADQGKFWEYHDLLYSEQNALSVDALKEKAKRLGLDTKSFDQCLDGGQGLVAVKADEELSTRLGLTTTPSSFVNGRFVGGAMALYKWKALIDEEVKAAQQKTAVARN